MTPSKACLHYLELFRRLLPLAEREEEDPEAEMQTESVRSELDGVWERLSRQERLWAEIQALKERYAEEFGEDANDS